MFLQLALLSFAVQWLGSPWQLGLVNGFLACSFFIIIVVLSSLPAMFREWGNIKSALLVHLIIQLVCLILTVVLPGIGKILAFAFNVYLFFHPVSFYKTIGNGFIFFFAWFIGLNNILGKFILQDPRGVFTGDLYLTLTDWVILAIFIAAIVRTIYHIITNFRYGFLDTFRTAKKESLIDSLSKDTLTEDTQSDSYDASTLNPIEIIKNDVIGDKSQTINQTLRKKEKKTLFPIFIASVVLITISIFIVPSWKKQAISDLKTGFIAVSSNNYIKAGAIANKYYNDKKILHNGDVFYLNGLVNEPDNPDEAIQFHIKAANWYDNHKSWINEDFNTESYYRLSLLYLEKDPPDYYKAKNTIDKAIKKNPENASFLKLNIEILKGMVKYEEEKNIRFFRRFWNRLKARF